MRDALLLFVVTPKQLAFGLGFWQLLHAQLLEGTIFEQNGNVKEELDVDKVYIALAHDRPFPFFRVAIDCGLKYMLLVRPGDGDPF